MLAYAYTGDVKKLKTIGFKFNKLYGGNHKCYSSDNKYELYTNICMFVVSKMVLEFDNSTIPQTNALIDFILENKDQPAEFWMTKSRFNSERSVYVVATNGQVFEYNAFFDFKIANDKKKREEIDVLAAGDVNLEYKLMNEAGVFFDPINIRKPLVDLILKLNDLGLSKIEI